MNPPQVYMCSPKKAKESKLKKYLCEFGKNSKHRNKRELKRN